MTRGKNPFVLTLCFMATALAPLAATAGPIPIDASNFTLAPDAVVTFNPDGSALLGEEPVLGLSQITNIPPTDPLVIEALPGGFLGFDFDFVYGTLDTLDEFSAVLLQDGVAIGAPYELFTTAAGLDQDVIFDLSGLIGTANLGIEFSLSSFDGEVGSTVPIYNLRTFQVPLPTTLLLLGTGLLGMRLNSRRKNRLTA